MFTGIINHLGTVLKKAPELQLETPFKKIKKGESVAVDGVCLTALKIEKRKSGSALSFEVSEETMKRSAIANLKAGAKVNLELALRAGDSISGHFLQGHVDAVGKIVEVVSHEHSKDYYFSYPPSLRPYLVPKGSIAVDGISLTLVQVNSQFFSVSVLPYTEQETSLAMKKAGALVNLEADIIAKVVAQNVALLNPRSSR